MPAGMKAVLDTPPPLRARAHPAVLVRLWRSVGQALGAGAVVAGLALAGPAWSHEGDAKAPSTKAAADAPKLKKQPFGPWSAGEKRAVVRQGDAGLDRSAHPVLGNVAKVPGDGPPPPPIRPDPDVPEKALVGVNDIGGVGLSSNPLYLPYLWYSRLFTKLDGPRCAHLPTCSRFAAQAVAKHGAVGLLMGLDRIIQPPESSAVRTLPQVEGWGVVRHLDPMSNYEFWNEERFTGFPLPTDESPLALPTLDENKATNGPDGDLPPPPAIEWTTSSRQAAAPAAH